MLLQCPSVFRHQEPGGYIHPGDAIVILAGIILGPVYGMLAGGIGSALSDLIGGYFVYVPITLVIKGLVALVSGLIYQKMCRYSKNRYVAVILGGITDIVFVAGGYFICEFFLYGSGAAASIPANIIQGVGGLIISAVLYPVLIAIRMYARQHTRRKIKFTYILCHL